MRDWEIKRIMQSLGERNEDAVEGRDQGLGRKQEGRETQLGAARMVGDSRENPLIDKLDAGYCAEQ
jgi:hypothetical protein